MSFRSGFVTVAIRAELSFAVLFAEKAENFRSFDQAFQNTRSAVREGEKLISMATNNTSAEGA